MESDLIGPEIKANHGTLGIDSLTYVKRSRLGTYSIGYPDDQSRGIELASVSFTGEFSPNFDLKNMNSTYTKEFSWQNNGPNSLDFKEKKFGIARFV
jgi:hypothetical protein